MKSLLLVIVYLVGVVQLFAASIQVYPADMRKDKSVQFIGEVSNNIFFRISSKEDLIQKIPNFQDHLEYRLKILLPDTLKLIGIENQYSSAGDKFITDKFKIAEEFVDGRKYNVCQVTIDSKSVLDRLVKNAYYFDLFVWVEPKAGFSGMMKWELIQGDKIIANGNNPLKTIGLLQDKVFSPDFIIQNWGADIHRLPAADMKERVQMIKKLGFTHVNHMYYNTPVKENDFVVAELQKAGIIVLGEKIGSFGNYQAKYMSIKSQKENGGLIWGAPLMIEAMSSPDETEILKTSAPWAQGCVYDLETVGAKQSPGLDDDATIEAFGASINIPNMDRKMIATPQYSEKYAAYRTKLCAAAVFGYRKLVDQVNPKLPIFLCHGSGLPLHELDYRDYDSIVQYHMPMIYANSPFPFLLRCETFNQYVNPQKSIPVSSFGWSGGPLTRSSAEDIAMDIVGAAMAGSKGFAIWPGMRQMDGGLLYGFYLGSSWIKDAVTYFQNGQKTDNIKNEPFPYIEKKLRVGARTIDLSQPQWTNESIIRTYRLGDEYLIGIVNYNRNSTIFVKSMVNALPDKQYYCVNLVTREYLTNNGQKTFSAGELDKGVLLKAKASNPAFWLLTSDVNKTSGCTEISINQINDEFTRDKRDYNANNSASEIQLGRKGAFDVTYENVKIDKQDYALLVVSDQVQKAGFATSGGRMMQWVVNNHPNLIHQNMAVGGAGMDLFWLPESGRWNGDQINEMKLISVVNTGKQVEIKFSGKADGAITAFRLEKTYTLVADKPGFTLAIKLINENPDPTSTISYWSHNVMDFGKGATGKYFYINAENKVVPIPDTAGSSKYFVPNKDILAENRKFLDQTCLLPAGFRVSGVYSDKVKTGVVVIAPKDFLSLYVWSRNNICSFEWMMQPQTITHGGTEVISCSFFPYFGEENGFHTILIQLNNQNK